LVTHPNMASIRPSRTIRPVQKLNEDNIGQLQLTSHRNFVAAAKSDPKRTALTSEPPNTPGPSTQAQTESVPESDSEPVQVNARKRRAVIESEGEASSSDNDNDSEPEATDSQRKPGKSKKKPKKKKKTARSKCITYSLVTITNLKFRQQRRQGWDARGRSHPRHRRF
jgi:hypothetical protein